MIQEHLFLIIGVSAIIFAFILANLKFVNNKMWLQFIAIISGVGGLSLIGYVLVKLFFMEPYQNEKDK
jgi:hypothetical protein